MAEELDLCAGCSRHVRVSASACPFCGCARAATEARELAVEPLHLSRAAIVALSASLVLAGCDRIPAQAPVYGGPPIVQPYGAPPTPPRPTTEPTPSASAAATAPTPTPGGTGTPSGQ